MRNKLPTAEETLKRLDEERAKKILDRAAVLLHALQKYGHVHGGGGAVYTDKGDPVMNTTQMYQVVTKLRELDINVERVDAGGFPTWVLK